MNHKLEVVLKKNKKTFIVIIILWILIAIVFVSPISYSIAESSTNGKLDVTAFITNFGSAITNPFGTLGQVFSSKYIGTFGNTLLYVSLVYLILAVIGLIKSIPKHEYSDIEHGSSDWCEGGEQYRILNSKNGILLAEKHFLPVDKRGNTNVLVVGRIRFTENLLHILFLMHFNC